MKLKLAHVTLRRNKDGGRRLYFRRRGQPLAPLPDDPLSPDFMAAYQRLLNWTATPIYGEGTFGWLCDQYMDSAEFKGKSPATRAARRRIIQSMTRESIDPKYPEKFARERIAKMTLRHMVILRDRKAANPNAANERLKILSQMFKLAVARGWRDDNPVRDVPRLKTAAGGHETATDEDVAQYLAFHSSGPARRAMVLLTSFGMRVSDLRILGPQHVRKDRLVFETVKTSVRCSLTIDDAARAEMAGCRDLVFLTSDTGAAYRSDKALSQRISKWFRQAGVKGITAHGIRKWRATRMAEAGGTEYELMAWFGWKDPKEARPYIQAASRERLATSAGRRLTGV